MGPTQAVREVAPVVREAQGAAEAQGAPAGQVVALAAARAAGPVVAVVAVVLGEALAVAPVAALAVAPARRARARWGTAMRATPAW